MIDTQRTPRRSNRRELSPRADEVSAKSTCNWIARREVHSSPGPDLSTSIGGATDNGKAETRPRT
jgi:hypothetical protein